MALAEYAGIAVEIQALPPQMASGLRKRAERQICLAGFEPGLELPRIQRHRADADIRCDACHMRNQRRQKHDHADIGQEQAELAIGAGGIEFSCRGLSSEYASLSMFIIPVSAWRSSRPQARLASMAIARSRRTAEGPMGKFIVEPHFRLQEWVAQEKGYFRDNGLDYEFRELIR